MFAIKIVSGIFRQHDRRLDHLRWSYAHSSHGCFWPWKPMMANIVNNIKKVQQQHASNHIKSAYSTWCHQLKALPVKNKVHKIYIYIYDICIIYPLQLEDSFWPKIPSLHQHEGAPGRNNAVASPHSYWSSTWTESVWAGFSTGFVIIDIIALGNRSFVHHKLVGKHTTPCSIRTVNSNLHLGEL